MFFKTVFCLLLVVFHHGFACDWNQHIKSYQLIRQFPQDMNTILTKMEQLTIKLTEEKLKISQLDVAVSKHFNSLVFVEQEVLTESPLPTVLPLFKTAQTPASPVAPYSVVEKTSRGKYPRNCADAMGFNGQNNIYAIQVPNSNLEPFYVYCERCEETNKPWLVVQRKVKDTVSFNRNWFDYQNGFGDLHGSFFIGLEKLHALTASEQQELGMIKKFDNSKSVFAYYSRFLIGSAYDKYILMDMGQYTGSMGDLMRNHIGYRFSTFDHDNDAAGNRNCALDYASGWWYHACYDINMNELYSNGRQEFTQMSIKPMGV